MELRWKLLHYNYNTRCCIFMLILMTAILVCSSQGLMHPCVVITRTKNYVSPLGQTQPEKLFF